MCNDTADKMIQLQDADPDIFPNIYLFKYRDHKYSVGGFLHKYADFDLRKVDKIGQIYQKY